MRFLERFRDEALSEFRHQRALSADFPEVPLEVVRWLAGPYFQDLIYGFQEHSPAVLVQVAQDFGIRE